jgi:hypothetical protein
LQGIPSHLSNVEVAQRILGPACAGLEPAQATASQDNMSEYFVAAWCVHRDMIPMEVIVAVPEPGGSVLR